MKWVTDSTFKAEVLEANKPVLVDYSAPWCAPCRKLAPVLEKLENTMPAVKFVKLDIDQSPITAVTYGIKSVPTLHVFKNGELAGQISPVSPIKKQLERYL